MAENLETLKGLLELAKEFGCVMTVDEVLNQPSEAERQALEEQAIQLAKRKGLTIVDAKLRRKLRKVVEDVKVAEDFSELAV